MVTPPDPLSDDEARAMAFYVESFTRVQLHGSVTDLRNAMEWTWTKALEVHTALVAKGYIGSVESPRYGAAFVTSIKRQLDGTRVKVMLVPVREPAA